MAAKKGRRAYGDGSIYQRQSDGRYVGSFRLGDGTRKYVYAPKDNNRESVVRALLREAQQKAERGTLVPTNKQRLADYLEYWFSVHKLTIEPITSVQYASVIRAHISPALGHLLMYRLTTAHIQRFISTLTDAGLATSTIRLIYQILNGALADAVLWKLLGTNPCGGVKLPRIEQDEIQALDPEQAQILLEAVKGTNLAGIVPLALATGMRRGELLALKWSDIDFERAVVRVQRTLTYINGVGFQEVDPKTKSSRRSIILAPFALDALREHRKQQLAERSAASTWQEKNLVFCNKTGGYLSFPTLAYRFKALLARADLEAMHFHALRHSCATLLIQMRVHPKVVQEILGHSSMKTTMDKYGHVLPGMQDRAMAELDGLLQGTSRQAVH